MADAFLTICLQFLINFVFSMSVDCIDVVSLAYEMNMHIMQPQMYINLSDYDCCSANNPSITCLENRVVAIDWNSKSLNGVRRLRWRTTKKKQVLSQLS